MEAKKKLRAAGIRAEVDTKDGSMGAKIKEARNMRIQYMAVAGGREQEAGTFSVRSRKEDQLGAMTLEELIEKLQNEIENKI
jgi:threonyl-tRNA synthetase